MPAWQFKRFVLVIRSKEYNFRERREIKKAKESGGYVKRIDMRQIPLPQYDPASGLVTYPGYQWPRIPKIMAEQKQLIAEMKKEVSNATK
jgi:hypothetical protein